MHFAFRRSAIRPAQPLYTPLAMMILGPHRPTRRLNHRLCSRTAASSAMTVRCLFSASSSPCKAAQAPGNLKVESATDRTVPLLFARVVT
eukprot:6204176-Pleurochrysis_carterae.AAC.2